MKADAHICSTDIPIGSGSQAYGLCGKQVVHAHLVRVWDLQPMGVAPDYPTKGLCAKCLEKSKGASGLIYVIREDKGEVVFSE